MSYDLMFNKANELYSCGYYDEAEKLYRNIMEAVPENADVLNMMGLTAQAKGLHAQAVSYFSQAIKITPKHLPLYFNLAISYQNLKKFIQAIDAYNKVLELNPNIKETYNNLGEIFEQLHDKEKAISYYQKALLLDNNYVEALVNLAVLKNDINALKDLNIKYPNSALIFYYLAKFEFDNANFIEALKHLDTANKLKQNSFEINLLKAKTNLQLKNIKEAAEDFYTVINVNPKCIEAWLNLAYIEENETYYLKVLDLDPDNIPAHANYANLLYKQNRTLEALEEYRKAVILNPDLPELSNNLALVLKDLGDYERALDLMMNAFIKDNKNIEFSLNIAETLILFYPKDNTKALSIAEKWSNLSPDNVFAKHTLASFKGEQLNPDNQYVKELFDMFALTYDNTMQQIKYAVIDKIDQLNIEFSGNILDLGCGTGAFASRFHNENVTITGIDISQNMLDIANKKNIYHKLINADIVDFLKDNTLKYNFVVAADVFEYIDNIEDVISNIGKTTLIFNIETANEDIEKYALSYNGRFKHNPKYVKNILNKYGYQNILEYSLELRQENGTPVNGILFVAKQ